MSGLNSEYYDLPTNIHSAQDLIEWLGLDFSNGNILKSLIREHNPGEKKQTDQKYEAEKRLYFAARHYARVSKMPSDRVIGAGHSDDVRQFLWNLLDLF